MSHARPVIAVTLVGVIAIAGLRAIAQTAQPAGLPQAVAAIPKQDWDGAAARPTPATWTATATTTS